LSLGPNYNHAQVGRYSGGRETGGIQRGRNGIPGEKEWEERNSRIQEFGRSKLTSRAGGDGREGVWKKSRSAKKECLVEESEKNNQPGNLCFLEEGETKGRWGWFKKLGFILAERRGEKRERNGGNLGESSRKRMSKDPPRQKSTKRGKNIA